MNQVIVDSDWIAANLSEGALFFDQADTEYKFVVDFSAEGIAVFTMADDIVIDLNGHTITFGTSNRNGTVGVYPIKERAQFDVGSADKSYSRTEGWSVQTKNLTVKNGRVIWGGTTGTWATCIGGNYTSNPITVENMYLESGGPDGMCINCGSTVVLSNTHAVVDSNATSNRHEGPACIKSGPLFGKHNILIGGNSSLNIGSSSVFHETFMRHSGYATNGYGAFLYRVDGVELFDCIIAPSNGRGVLFNKGSNHYVHDNLIVSHEKPNLEFLTKLNACCLRSRYAVSGHRFENNRCLAIAGGENAAGSASYLSEYRSDNPTKILGNEFRAVLNNRSRIDQYANVMTFEKHGKDFEFANTIIEGNKLFSNQYLLRLSGDDGWCYQDLFKNNSLNWASGNDNIEWFTEALNDYNFEYPSTNSYVNSALLNNLKLEVLTEVIGLIADAPDNMERHTFYGGFYTYPSMMTLMDNDYGPDVGTDASDVYSLVDNTHRGAIDIKIGNDGTVEHSLIKLAGENQPVVKYVAGEPIPEPDPVPDPIPDLDPTPDPTPEPDSITNEKLLAATDILRTIDLSTLDAQEIRDVHRAIGYLEVMRREVT